MSHQWTSISDLGQVDTSGRGIGTRLLQTCLDGEIVRTSYVGVRVGSKNEDGTAAYDSLLTLNSSHRSMPTEACLFCDIVSGRERSWVVYRDDQLMAVLDPYPMTKGHTLVIPIRHHESMFDIPDSTLRKIISLSKRLCKAYEQTLKIQGVSIELLNHRLKTPAHRHFHLHVIPRYDKDDVRDPANVKPSQTFPRESEKNLNRILSRAKLSRSD